MNLMTGGAEFGCLVERLQECLFVERRFRLHERVVNELQDFVFACRERIVQRFFDRIVRVPAGAVDVGDCVTSGAGDPCLSRWVANVVIVLLIERATKKWDGVVTTRAPSRSLNVPAPLQRDSTRLSDACQIGRIVKRTEMVHAVKPTVVDILMAFFAIVVHHQSFSRDEIA